MGWQEVGELGARAGRSARHTCSHPWLTRVDARARSPPSWCNSAQVCAAEARRPARSIAYPFGDHDDARRRRHRRRRLRRPPARCRTASSASATSPLRFGRVDVVRDEPSAPSPCAPRPPRGGRANRGVEASRLLDAHRPRRSRCSPPSARLSPAPSRRRPARRCTTGRSCCAAPRRAGRSAGCASATASSSASRPRGLRLARVEGVLAPTLHRRGARSTTVRTMLGLGAGEGLGDRDRGLAGAPGGSTASSRAPPGGAGRERSPATTRAGLDRRRADGTGENTWRNG